MSEAFIFSCLQCHLHQSLQRAWKRLQSLCSPAFCGVWFERSFYQEKCHKKFLSEPHQVLCFTMDTFLEYWIFPLQSFDRLEHVALLMIFVFYPSPRDMFYPPIPLLISHTRLPVLWIPLQSSGQLTAASLLILGAVLWELHSMAETARPCRPSGDQITARLTDVTPGTNTSIYCHWLLEKMFMIQKSSFFLLFGSETDARPCAPDFIG